MTYNENMQRIAEKMAIEYLKKNAIIKGGALHQFAIEDCKIYAKIALEEMAKNWRDGYRTCHNLYNDFLEPDEKLMTYDLQNLGLVP